MNRVWLLTTALMLICSHNVAANLLANAGLESADSGAPPDPIGWTEYGPDLTGERSLTHARSGAASAKRWTGGDFQEYGYYQDFPVVPGREYVASGYLFSPAGDALSGSSYACIRLEFYNAQNQLLLTRQSPRLHSANSAFQKYSTVAVAPGLASHGRFVYGVGGGASPHLGAAYLDDASVIETDISALDDEQFLDLLQRRIFDFFWNESSSKGLIKDRAGNFSPDSYTHSSIASVGFGLPVICIAEERGWVGHADAYQRVYQTLLSFRDELYNDHGFFYHFVNMNTGQPAPGSEISTIDTALFVFGALMAGEYFAARYGDDSLKQIAGQIYDRVDWPARYAGWSTYSEYIMMDLLAMGSATHPMPSSIWNIINRPLRDSITTRPLDHSYPRYFYPVLFVHQYPHCFIDFRFRNDAYTPIWTYFDSSTQSTITNRLYCIDHSVSSGSALPKFQSYGPDSWGLTAGDSPDGYEAIGEAEPNQSEPQGSRGIDGTVFPHGPGGSVMFAPDICVPALRWMFDTYGDRIWGRYGFSDAYNVDRNWWGPDVIGIDAGSMFLSIENYRTGRPWRYFMANSGIRRGLSAAGFTGHPQPSTDDFNDGPVNAWNGGCDSGVTYVSIPYQNPWVNGQALRVSSQQPGVLCFGRLDLTYDDYISFHVRGEAGGESLTVSLQDASGRIAQVNTGAYLTGALVSNQWQRVQIPLADLAGLHWPSIERLTFTLSAPSSAVLIDSLGFYGSHPDGGAAPLSSIGAAAQLPDGESVSLSGLVVTENFGAFFYVEQADRSAGIKVASPAALVPGDVVSIKAELATVDAERSLVNPVITRTGHAQPPLPLGATPMTIAGGALPLTGLRVRTWGVAGETVADEFTVSDGGRSLTISAPALPKPAPGQFVVVTGVAGARSASGAPLPLVRVRQASEINTAP
ncbi:MAG: hypothetical protein IT209_05910 [Armatimonadetes bacterium]|nr:hypothetical protein [Armatimonadota bacterium]